MNKKLIIIFLVAMFVVVAGFVYYAISNKQTSVPTDWKSYSSDSAGFSVQYDPTLTLSEPDKNDVRFFKIGPTQKGQTEMYDGLILSIRKIDVTDGGKEYIDGQLEQFKNVGTITEALHDSKLNGIPTKEYSASGLGDFKIIFMPINERALLEISYMVPDPTGAGFQKIVDTMLSTFQLK